MSERFDNREEFLLLGMIILFMWIHSSGEVCYWPSEPIFVLFQNGADSEARCISGDNNWQL
jgi:hypothetical protein